MKEFSMDAKLKQSLTVRQLKELLNGVPDNCEVGIRYGPKGVLEIFAGLAVIPLIQERGNE